MSVLVTMMKNTMQNRSGYVRLSDIDMMESYTFNKCIKIKDARTKDKITKWINFYEGTDIAVVFRVAQAKHDVHGEVVLFILGTEIKSTSEIGYYNSKRANLNYYYGLVYDGKLMTKDELVQKCRNDLMNNSLPEGTSNELVQLAKAPTSTPKPVQNKKFKSSLDEMTEERKEELKRLIFS